MKFEEFTCKRVKSSAKVPDVGLVEFDFLIIPQKEGFMFCSMNDVKVPYFLKNDSIREIRTIDDVHTFRLITLIDIRVTNVAILECVKAALLFNGICFLTDNTNNILMANSLGNLSYIYNLVLADPEDVTEQDEVMYEDILRNFSWKGDLKFIKSNITDLESKPSDKIVIKIKLKGVDSFNRIIFKDINKSNYYGSINTLFPDNKLFPNSSNKDIIKYFKKNTDELEYFGTSFGCEPHGGIDERIVFEIVD
jgi:hypothetical protein